MFFPRRKMNKAIVYLKDMNPVLLDGVLNVIIENGWVRVEAETKQYGFNGNEVLYFEIIYAPPQPTPTSD
jgi:hypothetical protein